MVDHMRSSICTIFSIMAMVNATALVPSSGALLGLYYGSGTIQATETEIGYQPQIHLTYYGWNDTWATSPDTQADVAAGRIPLVNWEPDGIDFTAIVNGTYDSQLQQQADAARALGTNFFLDFAAEMNEEEGWGGHNTTLYISAWRHIHDIFTSRNASNVVWVWCPNNVNSPGEPAAMEYYPGDSYVDWVGADGYNWGTRDAGFEWQSFEQVFQDVYSNISTTNKPIIIGEMASAEKGGSKAQWIEPIVPTLKSNFTAIKAVVWFDIDKERDWEINSSGSSLDAFKKLAADPYFDLRAAPAASLGITRSSSMLWALVGVCFSLLMVS